jgi:hypothetical protein
MGDLVACAWCLSLRSCAYRRREIAYSLGLITDSRGIRAIRNGSRPRRVGAIPRGRLRLCAGGGKTDQSQRAGADEKGPLEIAFEDAGLRGRAEKNTHWKNSTGNLVGVSRAVVNAV